MVSRTGSRCCSRSTAWPPRLLTLEIAEGGVISETERPLPTLQRLDALGVRLSVDDFGTGYSSLSHLRRLPVDEVKIDRPFVQGMATDPGDLAIVRAIVDLARHFDLQVVAEGVESELTLSHAPGDGLRHRAGLPVQPAAAVRPAGGVDRRADRRRTDARR